MNQDEELSTLRSIADQRETLIQRVIDWSNINTGTGNVEGINAQLATIALAAKELSGIPVVCETPPSISINARGEEVSRSVGPALLITKIPRGPLGVLLAIHADTVYPPDSPFQTARRTDDGKIHGPGVADAKGGLVVMLAALAALEGSSVAEKIGWEVLINPDEEIGSPGSSELFAAAAKRNHLGLLFEPALSDGSLVDRRKGSGNFSLVIRGRSAHAGRDFAAGRSAILAASQAVLVLHELNSKVPGATVNIGAIDGGGPSNVVPDLAIVRINCRTTDRDDENALKRELDSITSEISRCDGITAKLFGQFSAPPKSPDAKEKKLMEAVIAAGADIGLKLSARPSGGTCDGNRLSALGLPNIDTLGVVGGSLHSPDEFMLQDSLVERAQLTALLLMRLANGDFPI